jgi:hypothetical protein
MLLRARRVVGDLMRSAGHRLESVSELDSYLRRPRGLTGGHVQVPFLHLQAAGKQKPPAVQGEHARWCRAQGLEGLLRQAGEEGDSPRLEAVSAVSAAAHQNAAGSSAVHWARLARAPTA